ncbi:MAG: metallophosphoesterase family protein [Pseudomonadota bacterium]
MPEVFFTADTHFGHGKLCRGRPFADAAEMDRVMIARWNARVGPEDHVYHLGDFHWSNKPAEIARTLAQLNGTKTLIWGNHDHTRTRMQEGWHEVVQIKEIEREGRRIVLCHYPMLEWPGAWRGALHFFGHVHGQVPPLDRRCDVGVDAWDFRPVTLEEILARMAEAPAYTPQDNYAA